MSQVPMPAEPKINVQELFKLLNAHGRDLGWYRAELEKMRDWSRRKGVLRTERGWGLFALNWVKRALIGTGGTDGEVRRAVNPFPSGSAGSSPALSTKLTAYRKFQARGMGEWYLQRLPERERRAILAAAGA